MTTATAQNWFDQRPPDEHVRRVEMELFVKTPLEPADLLFVFGNRVCEDDYAAVAARMWNGGYFKHVLVTGGETVGMKPSEAKVIARKFVEVGIPDDVILLEERAMNTGENVEFSLPILEAAIGLPSIGSVIALGQVCTSRRYLMTLQRHWPEVRKMLHTINWYGHPIEEWPDVPFTRQRIMSEWEKQTLYKRQGFIVDWPE